MQVLEALSRSPALLTVNYSNNQVDADSVDDILRYAHSGTLQTKSLLVPGCGLAFPVGLLTSVLRGIYRLVF